MSTRKACLWGAFVILAIVISFLLFGYEKKIAREITVDYSVSDPPFRRTIDYLLGPAMVEGNKIETLLNGNEIFPSMLEAIRGAKKSVTFETYIWESGEVGSQFVEAFSEKAREKIPVLIIVDGMGTLKLDDKDIDRMRAAGVRFVKFQRARWYHIKPNLNHRTHRKILVVDGTIGFAGGACIGDKWQGDGTNENYWRDTHYRITGPSIGQLQGIFAQNWAESTGELLEGDLYFPPLENTGDSLAHFFASGPGEGDEHARLVFLYSIAAAQKSIRLSHAYFIPDDLSVKMLLNAVKRGVQVEVIVPSRSDSSIGRAAARSRWAELAGGGIKFFYYEEALLHCKVMVIDDLWVTAGSVNFDNRSFQINDEANINVLDPEFAAEQVRVFEQDKKQSRPVPAEELLNRKWYRRLADRSARVLEPQL